MERTIFFLLLCAFKTFSAVESCEQIQQAEIVLLVDESLSINGRDWEKQKQFLDQLTEKLDIDPQKIRVGLVAFDHKAREVFNLETHKTKVEVQGAIKALTQRKGATSIWKGIEKAEELFAKARKDAQKVLIVLTDGQSSGSDGPDKTRVAADRVKASGVKIISIGVGLSKYSTELKFMASGPEFLLTVNDMSSLMKSGFLDGALKSINCVAKSRQVMRQKVCKKIAKAELIILVDQSASINKTQFENDMKPFLKDLIKELPIGKDLVHVAIHKFSDHVQKVMGLGEFNTADEINSKIDGMEKIGKNTMTQKALKTVREDEIPNARKDVKKLVLVVTDGDPSYKTQTERAAEELQKLDVKILAVGVGDVNDKELKKLASSEELISHIEETEQLKSNVLKQEIVINMQCA